MIQCLVFMRGTQEDNRLLLDMVMMPSIQNSELRIACDLDDFVIGGIAALENSPYNGQIFSVSDSVWVLFKGLIRD